MEQNVNQQDNYNGWLNSDSFAKRMFAVWGYGFLGSLLISGIIFGVFFIIGMSIDFF